MNDFHHRYVDPTLDEHLQSRKRPWAFSPFVATMPHIHHTRIEHAHEAPEFPASTEPIADEMSRIRTRSGASHDIPNRQRKLRKAHFKSEAKRKEIVLGPQVSRLHCTFRKITRSLCLHVQDVISADFCHHLLEFGEDSIVLRLPCGI